MPTDYRVAVTNTTDEAVPNEPTGPLPRAHALGKAFIGGATMTLLGVITTDRATYQLANPAGSGKLVYVYGLVIYSNIAQGFTVREAATMPGGATTVVGKSLNQAVPVAPVAVVKHSNVVATGGVAWPTAMRTSGTVEVRVAFAVPLILPAGVSLTLQGDSTANQVTAIDAYWFEA